MGKHKVPYFQAWVRSKKELVNVLEINYVEQEIKYGRDNDSPSNKQLESAGFHDVLFIPTEEGYGD